VHNLIIFAQTAQYFGVVELPIGHLMRQLWLNRGLQQKELAGLAKVSRRTIGNVESESAGSLKNSTLSRVLYGLASASPLVDEECDLILESSSLTDAELRSINDLVRRMRGVESDAEDVHRSIEERFQMAVRLLTRHGIDREGLIILEALAEQAVARSASGRRDTDDGRRIYTVDGPPITMADGSPAQSATEYTFEDEDPPE
jgi:transcriptional regulator with XRE-family HTH domain